MFFLQKKVTRKEKAKTFIVSKCTHCSKQLFLPKTILYFTSLHQLLGSKDLGFMYLES